MPKCLKVRDLSLSSGQLRLLEGRIRSNHLKRILPLYREAGFFSIEILSSFLPEILMRDLNESPWDRIRECAVELDGKTLLGVSSAGSLLFGNSRYSEYVIKGWYKEMIRCGIKIIRIFDPLNDEKNFSDSFQEISRLGAIPDGTLCFIDRQSQKNNEEPKKKGFFSRLFGDEEIVEDYLFSDEYYIAKAKELESLGAGIISLKDAHGEMSPERVYSLLPKLKHAVKVPLDFSSSCAMGYGLASTLMAIIKGVDIIDTGIWWLAGGETAPPVELIAIFCNKLDIELDIDLEAVKKIRKEMKEVRKALAEFDSLRDALPSDIDSLPQELPEEIDAEFDKAIAAASENDTDTLLQACRKIESYYNFPSPGESECRLLKILDSLTSSSEGKDELSPTLSEEGSISGRDSGEKDVPGLEGIKLAQNEEDFLLLELHPTVATAFLTDCRKKEFKRSAPDF